MGQGFLASRHLARITRLFITRSDFVISAYSFNSESLKVLGYTNSSSYLAYLHKYLLVVILLGRGLSGWQLTASACLLVRAL